MEYTVDGDTVLEINVMGHLISRRSGVVYRFIFDKCLDELDHDHDPPTKEDYDYKRKIVYNNEIKSVTFSIVDVVQIYNEYRYQRLDLGDFQHFVLVYSIDSYSSFECLKHSIKRIGRTHEIGEEPVYITLIGNNCHLRDSHDKNNNGSDNDNNNNNNNNEKFVPREDAIKFSHEIAGKLCQARCMDEYFTDPIIKQQIDSHVFVSFWEVSDKTGLNVEKAFINLYIMQHTFEQFSKASNVFKIVERNKLLLICFGFGKNINCKKVIPKEITIIVHHYLDGLFWNDNQSSSNQCCCAII